MWTVYFAAKGVLPLALSAMRFAQFRAQDRYSERLSQRVKPLIQNGSVTRPLSVSIFCPITGTSVGAATFQIYLCKI